MIKINAIPLDYEPRKKIFSQLSNHIEGLKEVKSFLMSAFDTAFLCGVLKTYRPKKILEVGVASGGSTSIILQVLEDIGEPYEMHSVDLSKFCVVLRDKPTGFLATYALKNNLFSPPPPVNLARNTQISYRKVFATSH